MQNELLKLLMLFQANLSKQNYSLMSSLEELIKTLQNNSESIYMGNWPSSLSSTIEEIQSVTSTGELPTGKGIIGQLVASTNEQREFIKIYRRLLPLKKRIQLLEKLKECCDNDNGKLYAAFNQTITRAKEDAARRNCP